MTDRDDGMPVEDRLARWMADDGYCESTDAGPLVREAEAEIRRLTSLLASVTVPQVSDPNVTAPQANLPEANPMLPVNTPERLRQIAARLGFTDLIEYHRGSYLDPLVHARWHGAPVALSLRTGIAGGFSVAFYRGVQATEWDETGEEYIPDEWDEVADTRFADTELALVLGAALLDAFGQERAEQYAWVPSPSECGLP
jgi:hypothetical protein